MGIKEKIYCYLPFKSDQIQGVICFYGSMHSKVRDPLCLQGQD